jgi:hypothetical protein
VLAPCLVLGLCEKFVGWALACPELVEGGPPTGLPSARFHRRARKQVAGPTVAAAQHVALTATARRALGCSMRDDGWCSADDRPRQRATHGGEGFFDTQERPICACRLAAGAGE